MTAGDDLLPITLDDQIASVQREIAMRERVYQRQISNGRMTSNFARRELALMRAVLETLLHERARL